MLKLLTSNLEKYAPYRSDLERGGIELLQRKFRLEEIQTTDLEEAARHKAKQAFDHLRAPVMIDDAALLLDAYPGFPGASTSFVVKSVGLSGLQKLLYGMPAGAEMVCLIAACWSEADVRIYPGRMRGTLDFSQMINGLLPLNSAFIPDGQSEPLGTLTRHHPDFPTHRRRALELALRDVLSPKE
ncbi:MAG: non-canonical purine NTP pyrophosphatase [Bacteroidota bacterium]